MDWNFVDLELHWVLNWELKYNFLAERILDVTVFRDFFIHLPIGR